MSLTFDRFLTETRRTGLPVADQQDAGLEIAVIFTSVKATMVALENTGQLAKSLRARITLIVPHVVPYPLPLTSPSVPLDFQEERFRELANACAAEIRVQLYLCRDSLVTLKTVLQPKSVVVVGGRKRWWPTGEQRLARKLRSAGHKVIFAEID